MKTQKTILTLVLGIALLFSVSAIYSGETVYYDLTDSIKNLESLNCEIIGNSSNLEGLNLTENKTGFIISTQINYKPDNFNVSCVLNGWKEEKIIVEHSNSGGSNACYVAWTCSKWGECVNGISKRNCEKIPKYCFAVPNEKPTEVQSCEIQIGNTTIPSNDTEIVHTDTNDDPKSNLSLIVWLSFAGLIILICVVSVIKRKKLEKDNIVNEKEKILKE